MFEEKDRAYCRLVPQCLLMVPVTVLVIRQATEVAC